MTLQIHVLGVQRATEGFDARKFCDKRRYEYILPAWAFDPQACVQGRPDSPDGQPGTRLARRQAGANKGSSAARLADEKAALETLAAAVIAQPSEAGAAAEAADAAGDAGGGSTGQQNGSCAPAAAAEANGGSIQQQQAVQEHVEDELASTSRVGGDELHRLRWVGWGRVACWLAVAAVQWEGLTCVRVLWLWGFATPVDVCVVVVEMSSRFGMLLDLHVCCTVRTTALLLGMVWWCMCGDAAGAQLCSDGVSLLDWMRCLCALA